MVYPMGGTIDGRAGDHVLLAPPFIVDGRADRGHRRAARRGGGRRRRRDARRRLRRYFSDSRYAITSARSLSFFRPAKAMLVPGMNFFGSTRYWSSTAGVQATSDFLFASE